MYVKRILLRNFKSFPKATLELDKSFSSIVGPNGSGKSNVVDALMFAFGEMRLKSLRVKSTKDLIFKQHNVAESAVVLAEDSATDFTITELEENGKKRRIFPSGLHEVRRLIRKDGKTKYLLDGKKVKKYVIEDFLAKHSISLHHVIKQGEVQRIVEMNPKDRRQLLDFVSNVAEYEDKKREALVELSKVDDKLKEAQTVFAEREGYLKELEKDKKNAERFLQLESLFKRAAATLLHLEIIGLEKDLETVISANTEYRARYEELVLKIRQCEELIDRTHSQKDEVNRTISEKSQGREMALQKEIDGIEARITQAKALIDDKLAFTKKHEDRKRAVDLDLQKTADEIRGFEKQKARLETDVLDLKKLMDQEQGSLDKLLGQASNFSKQFFEARKTMDTATESMQKCKDELGVLQTEVAKSQELVRLKSEEHARLKRGVFSDFSEPLAALETQRKALRDALSPIEKSLNEFFSEEKEVNQRLPKLETLLLDLREKMTVSESKLRIAGDSSSKALEAVLSLRSKEKGIYGTVGEL
ncbi:MAG TPA: AAA family ATPase, partial [Candidatus Norongarragalinales archaeon]|nr:AAA family ATPase [Candidatus Norongarragalinales archaeon]